MKSSSLRHQLKAVKQSQECPHWLNSRIFIIIFIIYKKQLDFTNNSHQEHKKFHEYKIIQFYFVVAKNRKFLFLPPLFSFFPRSKIPLAQGYGPQPGNTAASSSIHSEVEYLSVGHVLWHFRRLWQMFCQLNILVSFHFTKAHATNPTNTSRWCRNFTFDQLPCRHWISVNAIYFCSSWSSLQCLSFRC